MTRAYSLSGPQREFLATLRNIVPDAWMCPYHGQRNSGQLASAWWRTAESLERRGYIRKRLRKRDRLFLGWALCLSPVQ